MGKKPENVFETSPSTAVIEAIAEHEGLDPMDLEQPLHEVVDPDALDSIIGDGKAGHAPSEVAIQFLYNGYRVHVSGDGSVEVSSSPSE